MSRLPYWDWTKIFTFLLLLLLLPLPHLLQRNHHISIKNMLITTAMRIVKNLKSIFTKWQRIFISSLVFVLQSKCWKWTSPKAGGSRIENLVGFFLQGTTSTLQSVIETPIFVINLLFSFVRFVTISCDFYQVFIPGVSFDGDKDSKCW